MADYKNLTAYRSNVSSVRAWRRDYKMLFTSAATQSIGAGATFNDDLGVTYTRAGTAPGTYTADIGANGLRVAMTREAGNRNVNWYASLDDLLQAQGGPAYVVGELVRVVSRMAVTNWTVNDDCWGQSYLPAGVGNDPPHALARMYRDTGSNKYENSVVDGGVYVPERVGTAAAEVWVFQELFRFGHRGLFATSEPTNLYDPTEYSAQGAANSGNKSADFDIGTTNNLPTVAGADMYWYFQTGNGAGVLTTDLKEVHVYRYR